MPLKTKQALFGKLCELYPLLKSVDVDDNLVDSLLKAHQTFFLPQVTTPRKRNELNNTLKTELAKPEFEGLKTRIRYIVKKYFDPVHDTGSLETIIPDVLLVLLAKYPLDDLNNKNYDSLDLIYGACEAESFQGWFDNEEHLKYLYLIEWQAPGLLSTAPDRSTASLIAIQAEIAAYKSTNPQASPADIELAMSQKLKFPEGSKTANRSALHPASRFLIKHQDFADKCSGIAQLNWPAKRLEELYATFQEFFQYHLTNFPEGIDANVIVKIIDRYKAKNKFRGLKDLAQLDEQCKKIIRANELLKGIEIKRPPGTPDNEWEMRKLACEQKYFILLFDNSKENQISQKTIPLDKFEIFLTQKRVEENDIQGLKRVLRQLFPNLVDKFDNEKIKTLKKIQEKLLRPIRKLEELNALALANRINFDEVMRIILDNNLIDLLQESNSNADIIRQCQKILSVATQVNTDAKDQNHKPAMMQIAMQLPGGYNHFKINPQNLEEALFLIKNRGNKSQDELIKELTTVGTNNYQRPKIPTPELSKENPVTATVATQPETQTLNVQSQPPVVTPTVATPAIATTAVAAPEIVQTVKPQTFAPEVSTQLTTAGMDVQNSFSVVSTLQAKHEVLLKALADWESRAQQDAAEKAELEEISQETEVKAYYLMLKKILAESSLAALVISSGRIDGTTGIGIKAISGLSTLSAAASSASAAVFPLAAPVLGFFKIVSGTLNSALTYREMQQHAKWVELEEIPQFAATLARRLALAQKRSIAAGMSRSDESIWVKIKNECGLFIEQLKSGATFSSGEKRALLDAQLLFEYILTHDRPLDMTLSGRINILLQHLVGAQATKTSSVSANNNNAIVVAQNNQPDITQLLQEIAALKAARETDQLDQQEQARRLQELHDKIRTLQEQQKPENASNHVDVGNGQIQLTMQTQDSAHSSSTASSATLTNVYKLLDEHGKAVAELGQQVAMTQEELTALRKSASGNTATNSDDEDDNEAGACCVM